MWRAIYQNAPKYNDLWMNSEFLNSEAVSLIHCVRPFVPRVMEVCKENFIFKKYEMFVYIFLSQMSSFHHKIGMNVGMNRWYKEDLSLPSNISLFYDPKHMLSM